MNIYKLIQSTYRQNFTTVEQINECNKNDILTYTNCYTGDFISCSHSLKVILKYHKSIHGTKQANW